MFYVMLGLRDGEILPSVGLDETETGMCSLRKILKGMGLYRMRKESDPFEVASCLIDWPEGHRRIHGYKLHHLTCIQAVYVKIQSIVRHQSKFFF